MDDITHARYADWDAAYVLGALSRAERSQFEEHLTDCAQCRAAIGDLAPLPGLLARVEEAEALALLDADAATVVPLPSMPPERRRRPRWFAIGMAAAVLLVMAVTAPLLITSSPRTSPVAGTIVLRQAVPSPLNATVRLTRASWGTQVAMTCTYAATYGGADSIYRLYVVDRSGRPWLVSSWHAGPGDIARTTGSTDLSPSSITAVQVRDAGGEVLLTGRA